MTKKYLFRIEILNKKDTQPLESIAYYSGERQCDILNGKNYISTTTDKVIYNKIIIPSKLQEYHLFSKLPEYLKLNSNKQLLISNARNILWKNVSEREKRPDSQYARLFEVAIPYFLTEKEATTLLSDFSKSLISEGMIVDLSLHSNNLQTPTLSIFEKIQNSCENDKNTSTPEQLQDYTGFLMCTLRDYNNGQFVNKNRQWNNPAKLKEWRNIWVQLLSSAIHNSSEASIEEQENWVKKLTIYPEFKKEKTLKIN